MSATIPAKDRAASEAIRRAIVQEARTRLHGRQQSLANNTDQHVQPVSNESELDDWMAEYTAANASPETKAILAENGKSGMLWLR
jgi:phage gp37-like protein